MDHVLIKSMQMRRTNCDGFLPRSFKWPRSRIWPLKLPCPAGRFHCSQVIEGPCGPGHGRHQMSCVWPGQELWHLDQVSGIIAHCIPLYQLCTSTYLHSKKIYLNEKIHISALFTNSCDTLAPRIWNSSVGGSSGSGGLGSGTSAAHGDAKMPLWSSSIVLRANANIVKCLRGNERTNFHNLLYKSHNIAVHIQR